jgi:hypothetical protein
LDQVQVKARGADGTVWEATTAVWSREREARGVAVVGSAADLGALAAAWRLAIVNTDFEGHD